MPDDTPKTTTRKKNRPFHPTPEHRYSVELMAGIGITQADIALALEISRPTLHKHFRRELDTGKTKMVTKVAGTLVNEALNGNITAMIFYLKTQGRWSEVHRLEHSHSRVEDLTDEELAAIVAKARDK